MKKKVWKYHTSHSFMWNGTKQSMASQLYQIGVYVICNNNPGEQYSLTPALMVKAEKKIIKDEKEGKITDLQFGRLITVTTDDDGLFVEINE